MPIDDDEVFQQVTWRTKVVATERAAFSAFYNLIGEQDEMSELQGVGYQLLGGELRALYANLQSVVLQSWDENGPKD